MAHEVENMFYVGARPWHGLGKQLEDAPTIKEGIIWAGLDWGVELKDLHAVIDGEPVLPVPSHKAVIRSTDQSILGIVMTDLEATILEFTGEEAVDILGDLAEYEELFI